VLDLTLKIFLLKVIHNNINEEIKMTYSIKRVERDQNFYPLIERDMNSFIIIESETEVNLR